MTRTLLLLDACVAINLAATNHLQDIAQAINVTFALVRQAATEAGHLRDTVNGELILTPIDLTQYPSDTVQIFDLETSEYPTYIDLARTVDDGEAATIAVAVQRNLKLATDDRKARRVCSERGVPEPLRTLTLLHSFTDTAEFSGTQIRDLLIMIRDRANFQPPRGDPDHKWWQDNIDDL